LLREAIRPAVLFVSKQNELTSEIIQGCSFILN
jgi:hypothetical protein